LSVEAVLFDLHGTIAHVEGEVTDYEASELLLSRGYEVYPQQLDASRRFVSFIDYPRYGYRSWETYLKRILGRLRVEVDEKTLRDLVDLYRKTHWKIYPEVEEALYEIKKVKLKTAIVTSIAKFKYKEDLKPIRRRIDLLVDSHTFRCEKSNPKIYMKTVEKLNVKPRQAVMIGDDVRLDVELPKKLGMKAILLDRRGTSISEGTFKPDFIVGNLTQAAEKIISGYL